MDKKRDWMGKPILDSAHHGDLEMNAAVNQFGQKMTKEQAESKAYGDYTRSHSDEAAAHHLGGIKQAWKAKDKEGARQHGLMYQKHMQNLGLDPMATPPEHILKLVKEPEPNYKFKPHKADVLMYSDSLQKAVPGAIARLGRAFFGKPANPKFTILPKGAAEASAINSNPMLVSKTPVAPVQSKPSKLENELMPVNNNSLGAPSQTPAQVMGFKGNPMKESGRQIIGRLKGELGLPRTGTKHQMRSPAKLNPRMVTRSPKDRNQIINEGLAVLNSPSSKSKPGISQPPVENKLKTKLTSLKG